MQLIRYNAVPRRSSVNTALDNFFNRSITDFMGADQLQINPAVNVKELEDAFHIELAAPGFQKDDFTVSVEDNQLTLAVEQEEQTEETAGRYTRREFKYGSFQRVFQLPETVNTEAIVARYDNGILTLVLPKLEEVKPEIKKIEIS